MEEKTELFRRLSSLKCIVFSLKLAFNTALHGIAFFRVLVFVWSGSHRMNSIKKLFLKLLQYSQESACVGVSF